MSDFKLGTYLKAIDTLAATFDKDQLSKGEKLAGFSFTWGVNSIDWLTTTLPSLLKDIIPADFALDIRILLPDTEYTLRADTNIDKFFVTVTNIESRTEDSSTLPQESVMYVDNLNRLMKGSYQQQDKINFESLKKSLQGIFTSGGNLKIEVTIKHDKSNMQQLVQPFTKNLKITTFFFPSTFTTVLRSFHNKPLKEFEKVFFSLNQRTVIFVLGFRGFINSDFVAVCGGNSEQELKEFLSHNEIQVLFSTNNKEHAFRQQESFWNDHVEWITPRFFDWGEQNSDNPEAFVHELQRYQALLAVLFLADLVDFKKDSYYYIAEFSGLVRRRFEVNQSSFIQIANLDVLVKLYLASYQSYLSDKLELTQQFIGLIATDVPSLVYKAAEIQEVTQKAFSKGLGLQAQKYFETRQKLIDYMTSVTTETYKSILDLRSDLASDLYKAVGVVAATYLGILAKPDLTPISIFSACLVISAYIFIILRNNFPALQKAFVLRLRMHKDYINSFKDVLTDDEAKMLLGPKQLGKSKNAFKKQVKAVRRIYEIMLYITLIAALLLPIISLISLTQQPESKLIIVVTPTITPTATATPNPTLSPPPTVSIPPTPT